MVPGLREDPERRGLVMAEEQLVLIPGARLDLPGCYEAVAEALDTVLDNQPNMREWSADRLATDVETYAGLQYVCFPDEPTSEEIEKAVRIYAERNGLPLHTSKEE